MKKEELRIGNHISFKGKWDGIIEELRSGSVTIKDNDGVFPYDVFEGIALTEELLLRLGFEKDSGGYHLEDIYSLSISENKYREYLVCFNDRWLHGELKLTEVHQLQNMYYCFTGKELTLI